jgi:hypothetical protein
MKKATKTKIPSKSKPPIQRIKSKVNSLFDMLENADKNLVAMFQQAAQKEIDFDSEIFGSEDPVDLFAEYLESCIQGNVDGDEKTELLADLIVALSDLRIDANGGDREAREQIQAIYDLLDNAIENHSLHPVAMMMTGKIFSDAGLAVPENLRQAMAEALQNAPLEIAPADTQTVARNDVFSWLLEVVEQAGQNPFDVYEYLNSLMANFPQEASARFLSELIASKIPVIEQAVAGVLLHPDAFLAQLVAEALAASAARTPVESSLIERLVRMRPWLPQARQTHLDATIRAMRLNASPPVKTELPKIIKCFVSACDGSGTRSLFATQRVGGQYQLVSVMMKLAGVADAMVLPELPKSAMDDMVRELKSSVPVMETDLAGITRMLGLAIADNFASGTLPPFKLVEVVESLGLGPVHPDHSSPMEIITGLLADLPAEQTNPTAVARAHVDIMESEFTDQWFEAGEELENLLYPVKGFKQRVAKLTKAYLPERRHFWARLCALSALALRGNEKTRHSPWKQLALVGRDIASDLPLDQIPLMKQVAKTSVRAFDSRL